MRDGGWREDRGLAPRAYLPMNPVELTDDGLVGGAGSTFIRMRKSASGADELAFDQDGERLIALMSVVANRPLAEADVLPPIQAAARYWQRGDKALANLRLVFTKLPKVSDQTSSCRLALAEHLLDNGVSPRRLLVELGLAAATPYIEKYNPDHVPSGNGRRSGQFDFPPGTIVVAGGDDEKTFETRELFGEADPKEELEHGHPISPMTGIPLMGGRGPTAFDTTTLDALKGAASKAIDKIGAGKGPIYGTAVHTEFKAQIKQMGRDDLHTEQSYLARERVDYGTPGSVRVDAAEGDRDRPEKVYDLKTG